MKADVRVTTEDRIRLRAAVILTAKTALAPIRLSRKYAYLILILEEFERFGTTGDGS